MRGGSWSWVGAALSAGLGALAPSAFGQVEAEFEKRWSANVNFDYETVQTVLNERPVAASALPLAPNSTVDAVTVFRDRAEVTRVRTADVSDEQAVAFVGLPHGLRRESLFAEVRSGRAEVVGVELVSGQEPAAERSRQEAVKDEMRALADELGGVRDRIEALVAQRLFLRSALLVPPGGDRAIPALGDVRGLVAYLGDAERELSEQLRKEEERANTLAEQLEPFLIRLGDPLATGQIVRVNLDAAAEGPVTVAIRYQVDGASWSPAYNARYRSADGRVGLEILGVLTQNTGETWADATLSLSTANPVGAGTLPELTAWKLTGAGGELAAGRGLVGDERGGAASGSAGQPVELVARPEGEAPMVFAVPGRRTIVGDGSQQRIPLATEAFDATTSYLAVPKQISEVFRSAAVKYAGNVPLLPGELAAYVDGDFVGTSAMPMVLPGEHFDVAFGTHERLKVERQLVSRTVERAGLKNRRYTFRFRATVRNFGATPETVVLLDQIPISEVDRIDVKTLDTSGAAAAPDDPPGTLRWRLEVPPGGDRSVEVAFSVTAPDAAVPYEIQQMMR